MGVHSDAPKSARQRRVNLAISGHNVLETDKGV
jgi:hypothetical protein